MDSGPDELRRKVEPVLRRFFEQNGATAPQAEHVAEFSARLHAAIQARGLPPPLGPGEHGLPSEIPEAEIAEWVAAVVPAGAPLLFTEASKQLVKTCFYPEFRTCRDSFCAVGADGVCRRQELARARKRVSGTHCVDCPHWTGLASADHAAFLEQHWRGDRDEFAAERAVFLPEDFRALRVWIRGKARFETK